jgi:hypothetical protein
MGRINRRKVRGLVDWTAQHTAYIALWNVRTQQNYHLGTWHRSGPWVEYLSWLQQQSRLFLKLSYIEDDIAQLSESDGDNEVVDEYDESTRGETIHPELGPFQNYMVGIFL